MNGSCTIRLHKTNGNLKQSSSTLLKFFLLEPFKVIHSIGVISHVFFASQTRCNQVNSQNTDRRFNDD